MEIIELSWFQLAIGFISLLIPAAILWWYRTGLNRKLAIATIRMTLQLLLWDITLNTFSNTKMPG